jgi:multiple sugar transport system ATP-binding protein
MANLSFNNVAKQYPGSESLFKNFNLEVAEGEFLVLVGPSGCGKSTLLRMAAGLEETTSGTIKIGGQNVTDWTPQKRNIAMVFQNYALYPHMTVRGNLAFPLKMRHTPRAEIKKRVQDISELLGLEKLLNRKPSQLSGGQSQRVAMGRALVRDPDIFLMDEPLSNLDAKLRMRLRAEIAELQNRSGKTTLYVTHDQTEAMTLGDRVAVLKDGELMQVGSPQTLYDRPANIFVAEFIGSPPMNLFSAKLATDVDGILLAQVGEQAIQLGNRFDEADLQSQIGQNVTLGIRPEHLTLNDNKSGANTLRVWVSSKEYLGHETLLGVRIVDNNTIKTRSDTVVRIMGTPRLQPQDKITIHLPAEKLYLFDPQGVAIR